MCDALDTADPDRELSALGTASHSLKLSFFFLRADRPPDPPAPLPLRLDEEGEGVLLRIDGGDGLCTCLSALGTRSFSCCGWPEAAAAAPAAAAPRRLRGARSAPEGLGGDTRADDTLLAAAAADALAWPCTLLSAAPLG